VLILLSNFDQYSLTKNTVNTDHSFDALINSAHLQSPTTSFHR